MALGSEVSKPMMIAAICAAVVVVGALGYYFVIPHHTTLPSSVRQKYMDHMKTTPTTYTSSQRRGSPDSGGSTYGVYGQGNGQGQGRN
jgi:hypothetical protein